LAGSLGIKDLTKMNLNLLCKWWWLLETGEGNWQDIVHLKYVKNYPICSIPNKINDSPLWKDLMKIRYIYIRGRGYKLNNGKHISFWKDIWLGDKPLCISYPVLFDLCVHQNCSVYEAAQNDWVINFKSKLHGILRDQWYHLAATLNTVILNGEQDKPFWKWTPSKSFRAKSVYEHLSRGNFGPFRRICKARLPEKIKIFMWLLEKKAILTKDNMVKRKWQGVPDYYFCGAPEDCDHLMFLCPIARVVWGVIAICFHQKTRPVSYDQF
jgi:hypothetical protein